MQHCVLCQLLAAGDRGTELFREQSRVFLHLSFYWGDQAQNQSSGRQVAGGRPLESLGPSSASLLGETVSDPSDYLLSGQPLPIVPCARAVLGKIGGRVPRHWLLFVSLTHPKHCLWETTGHQLAFFEDRAGAGFRFRHLALLFCLPFLQSAGLSSTPAC